MCRDYKITAHLLAELYRRYWEVFIIVVPIGMLFFDLRYDKMTLILQFLGVSATKYIPEWWYINFYILIAILFPLFDFTFSDSRGLIKRARQIKTLLSLSAGICIVLILAKRGMGGLNWYIFIAAEGYCSAKYSWIEYIYNRIIAKSAIYNNIIGLCIIVFVFIVRVFTWREMGSVRADIIYAPIFIIGILILLENIPFKKQIYSILVFLGKRSIYIWLIHPFLCYHFFQKSTYSFKYIGIIYIWTLLCSSIFAEILYELDKTVRKHIKN